MAISYARKHVCCPGSLFEICMSISVELYIPYPVFSFFPMSISFLDGRYEGAIGIVVVLWLKFECSVCYKVWKWWCVKCALVGCGRVYEFIPFFTFINWCVVWGGWDVMKVILWDL